MLSIVTFAHSEPSRPVLLVCTTVSDSNAKPCHEYECSIEFKRRHVFECRVLAANSCVLDAHTRMGACVPTPHICRHTPECYVWERRHPCVCVRPGRTNSQPRPCTQIHDAV